MSKILIVGGLGFIGTCLATTMLKEGHEVTVLDDFSRKGTEVNQDTLIKLSHQLGAVDRFDIVCQDIVDGVGLDEYFRQSRQLDGQFDQIFNLAAQVAVTTSITDPVHDFRVNAEGTLNLLESTRRWHPDAVFIFASTNKVYGSLSNRQAIMSLGGYTLTQPGGGRFIGINEKEQLDFHSPYGCSKGVADQYVLDYSRVYGLKTAVFRQSCIYGYNQFGVEDQGWVAHFALQQRRGKDIVLFGSGSQTRDLLYVDDLIEAYKLVVKNIDKCNGHAFNIGGGIGNKVSVIEIAQSLGIKPDSISYAEERQGDQKCYVSDNTKLKDFVGWEPTTQWQAGILKMFDWIDSNWGKINAE